MTRPTAFCKNHIAQYIVPSPTKARLTKKRDRQTDKHRETDGQYRYLPMMRYIPGRRAPTRAVLALDSLNSYNSST